MARLATDDDGHIFWMVELPIEVCFENDPGSFHIYMEDAERAWYEIAENCSNRYATCPDCGDEYMVKGHNKAGNWYELCIECGRAVFHNEEPMAYNQREKEK